MSGFCLRRAAVGIALVLTALVSSTPVGAQSLPALNCADGQAPAIDVVFMPLVQQIGPAVGQPIDCIAWSSDGTANQPTTTGLLGLSADGSLIFINEQNQDIYALDASGFTYQPGDGSDGSVPQPTPPVPAPAPPGPVPAPSTPAPAPAPTVAAGVTPGKYGCFAQNGGGTATQVNRTGAGMTKEIYADGTWRDTSYGSMTANNPKYAGPWSWDGTVLTLTWGSGSIDTFHIQRQDGKPALIQFGSPPLLSCYLIAPF
jgi:hypothetical protein